MATINDFLAAHPTSDDCKWIMNRLEKLGLALEEKHCDAILAFCIRIQDEQANAISRKDAMLNAASLTIDDLRAERERADAAYVEMRDACNELRAELLAAQTDAAELHDIIGAQRELIERLQRRLARKEAKA